jgi:hypothetical protein
MTIDLRYPIGPRAVVAPCSDDRRRSAIEDLGAAADHVAQTA